MSGPGPDAGGDACEGGTQCVDNLLDVAGKTGAPADVQAAVELSRDALTGGAAGINSQSFNVQSFAPVESNAQKFLPDVQLGDMAAMQPGAMSPVGGDVGGALHGLVDSIMGAGSPLGFLGKLFEALFSFLIAGLEHVMEGLAMPAIELYNQAAAVSLAALKDKLLT